MNFAIQKDMNPSFNMLQASIIAFAFCLLPVLSERIFSFFHNTEIIAFVSGSVSIVVLLIILLYYFGREHTVSAFGLTKGVTPAILMAAIVGGIATLYMPIPILTIASQQMIKEIFESIKNETGLLTFISMAIIAPIVEEVILEE